MRSLPSFMIRRSIPAEISHISRLIKMISPAADNWFFTGNRFWPYYANPNESWTKFWQDQPWVNDPLTVRKLGIALVLSIIASRIGLGIGNWLSTVRR